MNCTDTRDQKFAYIRPAAYISCYPSKQPWPIYKTLRATGHEYIPPGAEPGFESKPFQQMDSGS